MCTFPFTLFFGLISTLSDYLIFYHSQWLEMAVVDCQIHHQIW
jgi:hypothetical protein